MSNPQGDVFAELQTLLARNVRQEIIGAYFSLRSGEIITIDGGKWYACTTALGLVKVSETWEGFTTRTLDPNEQRLTAYYEWQEFWHFYEGRIDLERWA